MPAVESPDDNSALIGGIVGGAIALLLLGALIAFCVARSRRNRKVQQEDNSTGHIASTLQSTRSEYGRIVANNPNNDYADVPIVPPSNYDTLGRHQTADHSDYKEFAPKSQ
jgi:type II secretory pathway pseudopilin PulG